MKLQRLLKYLGEIHLWQRLGQFLSPKREHVHKLKATFLLDLVDGNMMILQPKLHDVGGIINAIVKKAASLTDEIRDKFPDERGLPAADRSHQSDRGGPRKAAAGDFVEDWYSGWLESFNSVILHRPLQRHPLPA